MMECNICMGSDCKGTHELECGHKFHTECIVAWFRSGQSSCPLCRDGGCPPIENKLEYLKRLTKMDSCPQFIRDAIEDFQKLKKEIKNLYSNYDESDKKMYDKIKRKKMILKAAKHHIRSSHVFIVPIKKFVFD